MVRSIPIDLTDKYAQRRVRLCVTDQAYHMGGRIIANLCQVTLVYGTYFGQLPVAAKLLQSTVLNFGSAFRPASFSGSEWAK